MSPTAKYKLTNVKCYHGLLNMCVNIVAISPVAKHLRTLTTAHVVQTIVSHKHIFKERFKQALGSLFSDVKSIIPFSGMDVCIVKTRQW